MCSERAADRRKGPHHAAHPSLGERGDGEDQEHRWQAGKLTLPLASSAVSETDSVVQVEDGRIVAIGGMMKQSFDGSANRVPGLGQIPLLGYFFGNTNTNQSSKKSELVILIKPTVIDRQKDRQADAEATQARLDKFERQPATP